MSRIRCLLTCVGLGLGLGVAGLTRADPAPKIEFRQAADRLVISVAGRPLAEYVFHDPKISRPYFTRLHAPNGVAVSRNHPPIEGKDATDHTDFHPGLWEAYGDLDGQDTWRLKARVDHVRFVEEPRSATPNTVVFSVANRLRRAESNQPFADQSCRYEITVRNNHILIIIESLIHPIPGHSLTFGDQEEMGFGFRLSTPITVKGGGRIVDAAGRRNEAEVWGKHADWCDASTLIDGTRIGVTLMPDPATFKNGWFHVRDYGLLVANPFAGPPKSRRGMVPTKLPVETPHRFRIGVLLRSTPADQDLDIEMIYRSFIDRKPS